MSHESSSVSRRDFLRTTAAAAAAAAALTGCADGSRNVSADRSRPEAGATPALKRKDTPLLRVGLIGCGGRGTGAAIDCVNSSANIEIVALGDLFRDRLDDCRKTLAEKIGPACKVTEDKCFTGFDNYKGVVGSGVDMVILATPPGFRPPHLAAAIEAGKHVFMEKPVAVDPIGIRSVLASSESAAGRKLAIVCGTQRRHQPSYLEAMKRIQDGQIGEVVAAQCYWNQGELWVKKQEPSWSDVEWQCRNWLYFTWLSGDHIVEQHVHNLDVCNWAFGGPPAKCVGMGGRQSRIEPEYGNIFDHFAIEYEYPSGGRMLSMCRQAKGASDRVAERIVGTKGVAYFNGGVAKITGSKPWDFDDQGHAVNPYVQEHADLVDSIRSGKPLNEGKRIAESTLTAIMGRMSAYTGRELQWDWVLNASKLDLVPPGLSFGPLPVEAVAVPGQTKLV